MFVQSCCEKLHQWLYRHSVSYWTAGSQQLERWMEHQRTLSLFCHLSHAYIYNFHSMHCICSSDLTLVPCIYLLILSHNILFFKRLKGLIRGFYNSAPNKQTCLLLLPLTWMQQQPSSLFSEACHGSRSNTCPLYPRQWKINQQTNE